MISECDKRDGFKDTFHIILSSTIYLGDIPASLRVSELKNLLKEQEAIPSRINWQGAQHRAFLHYADSARAEHALQALKKTHCSWQHPASRIYQGSEHQQDKQSRELRLKASSVDKIIYNLMIAYICYILENLSAQ